MNKDNIKTEIIVKEQRINVLRIDNKEFISLTDLARYANSDEPKIPIYAWMRNKDVLAYLGLWEQLNNENFKGHEFETFENEAGKNSFYMSPQNGLKKQMLLVLFLNLVIMAGLMLEVILHLSLLVGYLQSLNYM